MFHKLHESLISRLSDLHTTELLINKLVMTSMMTRILKVHKFQELLVHTVMAHKSVLINKLL